MGERGPLPLPYARRRNKRRVTGKTVAVGKPSMPGHLSGEAKAEWRRVVPQLEEIGVLATIDRSVLIRYCTAWAEWLEMDGLLRKSGKVIRGQKGNLVRSELEQTLSDLGRQLGLSPVARLRAGITHERNEVADDSATIAVIEDYRRQLGVS